MPCLLAALAFFMPRVVIVLLVIFGDWIGRAYDSVVWPLLGFIFFPYTTLAYALAMHNNAESVSGIYLVILVIAVLLDLGAMGGGAATRRAPVRVK